MLGLRESEFPGRKVGVEPGPAGPAPSACSAPSPPARAGFSAVLSAASLGGGGGARLSGSPAAVGSLLLRSCPPQTVEPCHHEGTAQRVSASRPPRIAAVRALVALAGGKPRRPKLGLALWLDSGLRASRKLPRFPAAKLQVRPRGFPLAQGSGPPPPTSGFGMCWERKSCFLAVLRGDSAFPTRALGLRELFAPFRAVCEEVHQTRLFLNRPSTSQKEGERAALPSVALQVPKGQLSA